MRQTFVIEGMHCGGCVKRVTSALQQVADQVEVTLEPPRAVIEAPAIDPAEVQAAVARAGDYRVLAE